jgi:hypothetical protein
VFIQWGHPLQYLRLNMLATKKWILGHFIVGILFILALFGLFIIYVVNGYSQLTREPQWFMNLMGVVFLGYLIFNFRVTLYAFKSKDNKKISFHQWILLIPFAPIFAILTYLIVSFLYLLFGGVYNFDYQSYVVIYDNDSLLVVKLLIRLFLIVLVTEMFYIFVMYTENLSQRINLKIDENKTIRNAQIEKKLTPRSLSMAFLIGTIIAFFHFAEIDTLGYSSEFQLVFERTISVYHLVATAVFIPLLFDHFNSSRKSKVEEKVKKRQEDDDLDNRKKTRNLKRRKRSSRF